VARRAAPDRDEEPVAASPAAPAIVAQAQAPAPPSLPSGPSSGPRPPVIDEIRVEKSEVCEGEDNLISVRAHTEDGTDAYLRYVIDGKLGSSVPLRIAAEDGRILGEHSVEVFGKDNVLTSMPIPPFKIKRCKAPYLAEVHVTLQPNAWADYDFVATIGPFQGLMAASRPPPPFVPVRFEWSFGDGQTATTRSPTVSHSYETRDQRTAFSYMNVSVKMFNRAGDTALARTSLSLSNPAFDALAQKGIVVLLLALDPRFPEMDDQGRVEQHVKLWHTAPDPVRIDAVAVTNYFSDGTKSWESAPEPVDVGKLLGGTTIPPGKDGVRATVVLETASEPNLVSATYRLTGKSAKDEPVMGSFSVMRPPANPTADNSQVVNDPVFKAKILAAREILGKPFVNDREIAMLDRQGQFANLDVQPLQAQDTQGPTTAPPGATLPAPAASSGPHASTATAGNSSPVVPRPTGEVQAPAVPHATDVPDNGKTGETGKNGESNNH
jgi:hypothetical protein